jgi:hypothetical protein
MTSAMENGYEISNMECSLKTLATEVAKHKDFSYEYIRESLSAEA